MTDNTPLFNIPLFNAYTERPGWDDYGLEMAKVASLRADCTRRRVGAALMLPDHSVVVSGYNGGPSKGPSCLEGQCPRGRKSYSELPEDAPYDTGGGSCVALHAEWNVLLRATWEQMDGATLYITEEPCHVCKVLISGTRILRVVWPTSSWVPGNRISPTEICNDHRPRKHRDGKEPWCKKCGLNLNGVEPRSIIPKDMSECQHRWALNRPHNDEFFCVTCNARTTKEDLVQRKVGW